MHKKTIIAATLAAAAFATSAAAQAPAAPAPTCPASGIGAPLFGVFGGNDGIPHPYEVMGPCTPPEVRASVLAMGLGRSAPLSLKAVGMVRFSAKGTWNDAVAGPVTLETINWHTHFYYPAARAEIKGTTRNGKAFSNVEVFNTDRAWDETTPGVGPKKAPAKAFDERRLWPVLLPQGALLSIVEAQATVKISKDAAGKTVITGKSPYEPWTVTITLNDKSQVEKVVIPHGGATYQATFQGYFDMTPSLDRARNKWEPAYLVNWPDRIVWTKNGRPLADMTTTEFKSNPYMVMPYPELLKAEPEEADKSFGYDKNNPGDDLRDQFNPNMNTTGRVGD